MVEMGPHQMLLGTQEGPMYTELYQLYQSKYEQIQRHRLLSCMTPLPEGDGEGGMLLLACRLPWLDVLCAVLFVSF